ncbi:MAG: MBL fold metallo-hydrolase [Chloroflexi bacterium]|nr:MBL fold metallo-hydrolase [Chloroflexota bacterium]MBT4142248.1 MBL fold metallo-hydrolase [Chloroflexota bacterium]MBT4942533.1 MBL fold metallo-hydrolase [Chloroflexota bacterium]MBT5253624.1 MBL fold metallo-hydrolase [Chloroflexota bacterium]MBT5477286.1 MBL fold metallo-hydrolase [Chloroflexota bacterium]
MPISGTPKNNSSLDSDVGANSVAKARIVFLGTGTSEGVPRVSCLTSPDSNCPVCPDALKPGSPNRRRNTSLLIQREFDDGRKSNIVIDAGKFFYESAIQLFPKFDVRTIDALVITHSHADAVGGFDDLRDWTNNAQESLPIYLREVDLQVVEQLFYYLVDRSKQTGGGGVAKLNFETIDSSPFRADGLELTPLPVEHGKNWECFGYRFGDVSYISDASHISEETAELIRGSEILVVDALRPARTHGTHFTVEQAIDQALRLGAERTLLVDATHDIDHVPVNTELAKLKDSEGLDIQYAYDGLDIEVEL